MSSELIYYKNDAIIFCKAICTHCGSESELLHVELTAIETKNNKHKFHSNNTILCRDCYKDLPEKKEELIMSSELIHCPKCNSYKELNYDSNDVVVSESNCLCPPYKINQKKLDVSLATFDELIKDMQLATRKAIDDDYDYVCSNETEELDKYTIQPNDYINFPFTEEKGFEIP
jgi:hypothetical protein